MKIYLDTSSLFKLYHNEAGTAILDSFFIDNKITTVYLSELAKTEFTSAIWKKVRKNELDEINALEILELFETDFKKYTFITIDSLIKEQARMLLSKYGKHGLRTLDSIQLSTCLEVKANTDKYFTADMLLSNIFELEGLTT